MVKRVLNSDPAFGILNIGQWMTNALKNCYTFKHIGHLQAILVALKNAACYYY